MFFGAFLLLTQVGYSDGDDAFFYQYTHEMGFFEYLSWRYQTWVGRMSGEAMVYIAFSLGIWFWRIVNAMMLVLLPCGVLKLAEKAAGIRTKNFLPGESVAVVSGYLLMAIMTVGYAAIWINGSIFYIKNFVDLKSVFHKFIQTGTGNDRLYVVDTVQQIVLPAAVQFRQHVIQQKHRRIMDHHLYQFYFR